MNSDELDRIRESLFSAMDEQRATDIATLDETQKLGQQKIMYNNDARGTLYSGQPTWERAQLAAEGVSSLADLNNKYLSKKLSVWDNITNVLDQIESYNKAAAAMSKATSNTNSSATQSYLDVYNSLFGGN